MHRCCVFRSARLGRGVNGASASQLDNHARVGGGVGTSDSHEHETGGAAQLAASRRPLDPLQPTVASCVRASDSSVPQVPRTNSLWTFPTTLPANPNPDLEVEVEVRCAFVRVSVLFSCPQVPDVYRCMVSPKLHQHLAPGPPATRMCYICGR